MKSSNWFRMYMLSRNYWLEHHNLLVKDEYLVMIDSEAVDLEKWLDNQRRYRRQTKLSDKK